MSQQHEIGKTHTRVYTDQNGVTRVQYHDTDVVAFDNKQIVLDTGSWRTQTTKMRMNQTSDQFNLGFHVYQRDYEWFVDFKGETRKFNGLGIAHLER